MDRKMNYTASAVFFFAVAIVWILWSMYADRGQQIEDLRVSLRAARTELNQKFECGEFTVEDFDINSSTLVDDVYLELRFEEEDGDLISTCEQDFHRNIPAG